MAEIRASRSNLRNAHDKLAFAVHANFIYSGYLLTTAARATCSDTALSSTPTDEVGIEHWNELEDAYAFVYFNPEKGSKKVLVKCLVMNDKLLVAASLNGTSDPIHLEINLEDYVSENGGTNYSGQFKNLEREIFSKLDG